MAALVARGLRTQEFHEVLVIAPATARTHAERLLSTPRSSPRGAVQSGSLEAGQARLPSVGDR
jgi:hypothetical protein